MFGSFTEPFIYFRSFYVADVCAMDNEALFSLMFILCLFVFKVTQWLWMELDRTLSCLILND